MKELIDSLTSYMAGGYAMLAAVPWDSVYSVVVGVGGFVLLLCRLYVDVPKAYHNYKERNNS